MQLENVKFMNEFVFRTWFYIPKKIHEKVYAFILNLKLVYQTMKRKQYIILIMMSLHKYYFRQMGIYKLCNNLWTYIEFILNS
jgi:hypothetical protein